jgi:hypothetical protein
MTPLRTAQYRAAWSAANGGFLDDIQAMTDPGADKILFWDDSASAVAQLGVGSFLTITGTTIDLATSGTLPAFNGSALTSLNATNLASGTVSDSRLSANVALLNAANTFTANQTISLSNGRLIINDSSATGNAVVRFNSNGTAQGYVGFSNGTSTVITGDANGDMTLMASSGNLLFSGNSGSTIHFKVSSSGVLTTPNASAGEVGYKGTPANSQSGNYTLVLTDAGKVITNSGASAVNTIPANASVAFPTGTVITWVNTSGTTQTIAITSNTLYLAGTASTGTRNLAAVGMATAVKISSTEWVISGAGVT